MTDIEIEDNAVIPMFTVVIPTYNRSDMLQKAIKSVLKQTCDDWEILVMDDASTDSTEEIVANTFTHSKIRYYRMEKNSGISKVMNKALGLTRTPYLIQLDSDDWLAKRTLERFKQVILKNQHSIKKEKCALYYGNMNVWRVYKGKYRKRKGIRHRQIRGKYDFLQYDGWMVAPRCYRVNALQEVGGWDTSDKYGGRIMEDRRMILRLIEKFPVQHIDKTLYNRTKHRKQLTEPGSIQKRNYLRRQTYEYYLKRWGNKYRAIFGTRGRFLVIKQLVRRKKKRGHRK
ncbi:glycosyltransferase family 2 protein [Brevibacillus laterosporus]|uniref:glycosyltransferase family 2 protein n=1 Tax=Brevibacillus laterosporus TaxID=1465 RepID=UPI0003B1F970|nr:glycosyltransferase family 2 protein [Brevibacillus laterosporus]ERM20091.1 glycosyl transferase [Brevibacillus laterosporus PE36]